MQKNVAIYGLNDPDTGECRYIGKADNPQRRFGMHTSAAVFKEQNKKSRWIQSLLRENKKPVLEIIDWVPQNEWPQWEREYIRVFSAIGFRLMNGTEGGEGARPTEETRRKMSIAHLGNTNRLGKRHTKQTCENLSKARRGKKKSLSMRQNLSAAKLGKPGHPHTSEALEKMRVAHTGKKHSPETIVKMRAAQRLRFSKNKPTIKLSMSIADNGAPYDGTN